MIKAYLAKLSKSGSLKVQIREAEQQIVIRQRKVGVCTDALIKKIYRRITAPSTLLLSVGIGFILGELTTRQTAGKPGVTGKQSTTGTSPLRIGLNLITTAHTLYTALPMAWKVRIFHPSAKPGRQAPERQAQAVPAASGAASNRRR